jgi:DNA polymerase-3 subunit alpha
VVISLYRPGPIQFIPDYIARKHGREKVTYIHPKLEPILKETYGICITGDAIVFDVRTGQRYCLDEVGEFVGCDKELHLQGINEKWKTDTGRVTRWVYNGCKPIYRLTLRNGASIKATADHKFLTEQGWRELRELQEGDYIATPKELIAQNCTYDKRKLRTLAYLLADGDISNLASVNFVSKNLALISEYERCLTAFPNLRTVKIQQVRSVIRVSVAKDDPDAHYHDPNSLLAYLRELGLKYPPGHQPGGVRAPEKFVPDFVFALDHDHIVWFLASLWDCDGYMGERLCHYRTISRRLAEGVQTLLLKLGIQSTIYTSTYEVDRDGETRIRESYQVTVYETAKLARWLQHYMVTDKSELTCIGQTYETIRREDFIAEVEATTELSKRKLMAKYGIDRQHFYASRRQRPRISAHVVAPLAEALALTETQRRLNVNWEKILRIEPAGEEDVYDVTVDGLHNFVANNIIVHNCVYQEQIIRTLTDLAGYSAADADLMRRAVGKKKEEELLKHRETFIEGAIKYSGIEADKAREIFDAIEYFSNYGFNKSHAVSYAVITCQTAWLKAKYPLEYMAALLTVERNNTDKVGLFLAECHRMGIEILPPDVGRSGLDFTIETGADRAIRFGLGAVKNVGEGPIETILTARGQGGPFRNIEDFCQRVDLRQVNRRALECLIKVGALDAFGQRSQLLAIIDPMIALSQSTHQAREVGQLSMFDASSGFSLAMESSLPLPDVPEVSRKEMLAWEKELVGFYVSEHPLQQVAASLDGTVTAFCGEIDEQMAGQKVVIAGVVAWMRPHTTKNGNPMAFVHLEDLRGSIEVIVFPSVYEKTHELWQEDKILVVKGRVDTSGRGEPKVICESVQDYLLISRPVDEEKYRPTRPRHLHITIPRTGQQEQDIECLGKVHSLLRSYEGDDHFSLYLVNDENRVQLEFPNATTGYCPALEKALVEILGAGAMRVENQ